MENRVCTKVWKQERYVWASPQPQGVITTELGKVYWGHLNRAAVFWLGAEGITAHSLFSIESEKMSSEPP